MVQELQLKLRAAAERPLGADRVRLPATPTTATRSATPGLRSAKTGPSA